MFKTNTRLKFLLLLLIGGLCWQGCTVINPAEPTPTYIHIDSFHFVQNNALHTYNANNGAQTTFLAPTSHSITVAFVYYNNSPVGIFDLPATFPIIATGSGHLEISPGIIADGENNDVINYPFYTIDTSTFTAQPGKIINYTPQTQFYSDAKVSTIANFEFGLAPFGEWQGSPVGVFNTQQDSLTFEGFHSGEIRLTSPSADSSVDSTSFSFAIPSGQAYIEFDYNTNIPFYVGLQANVNNLISTTPDFLSGIYPGTGWQKFYLEVDGFTAETLGTSYYFYIKTVLLPGQTNGRLLIDNIQLVTF